MSLPFLYLYATGYRFNFGGETNLVSTGGFYIAIDQTGTTIFLDDELVRESRVFRRAFYVQGINPGTHRLTVQKEGYHTWVKELPVAPHLVTEAFAFNLPEEPHARVVGRYETADGVVVATSTLVATSTNQLVRTVTPSLGKLIFNPEFTTLIDLFATSTATTTESITEAVFTHIESLFSATSTPTTTLAHATTTKLSRDVLLYERGDSLEARWLGGVDDLPYYYCTEDFPAYTGTTTPLTTTSQSVALAANASKLIQPVQTVHEDAVCDPRITVHTQFQDVRSFDFFPGSTDLVVMALEDGVYVIEIDPRAWQNVQPLVKGANLDMRVENGQIYVYDGSVLYQMVLELPE
ncbi:hypothetical protein KC727_03045 [Candidatus Kaiserbacteria bacterium]|nr:hypothetical protein [Candidatus Kaiserbacteria bacterium]